MLRKLFPGDTLRYNIYWLQKPPYFITHNFFLYVLDLYNGWLNWKSNTIFSILRFTPRQTPFYIRSTYFGCAAMCILSGCSETGRTDAVRWLIYVSVYIDAMWTGSSEIYYWHWPRKPKNERQMFTNTKLGSWKIHKLVTGY